VKIFKIFIPRSSISFYLKFKKFKINRIQILKFFQMAEIKTDPENDEFEDEEPSICNAC